MTQLLHVLIVDPRRGDALIAERGGRWLLPILQVDERTRAAPLVERWARDCGIRGRMIGQWLGRLTCDTNAVDWLAIVSASLDESEITAAGLRWASLASVASSNSCVEYQDWATRKTLANTRLPSVPGPFGSMTWIDDVECWIGESCSVPYRLSAQEVVLECRRDGKRAFFKGLGRHRAAEALLTCQLAALAPDSFPKTIDMAIKPDGCVWWLMEACAGAPLSTDLDQHSVTLAAAAYARIQHRMTELLRFGESSALRRESLRDLCHWAIDFTSAGRDRCRQIVEACERVDACGAPGSWVFTDFDPRNTFVAGDRVSFIDLDDSVLCAAPIGVATFVRRLRTMGFRNVDGVYRSYFEALQAPIRIVPGTLSAFELVSMMLESRLAWQRVRQKSEAGEVYGAIDCVRQALVRRLAG